MVLHHVDVRLDIIGDHETHADKIFVRAKRPVGDRPQEGPPSSPEAPLDRVLPNNYAQTFDKHSHLDSHFIARPPWYPMSLYRTGVPG